MHSMSAPCCPAGNPLMLNAVSCLCFEPETNNVKAKQNLPAGGQGWCLVGVHPRVWQSEQVMQLAQVYMDLGVWQRLQSNAMHM